MRAQLRIVHNFPVYWGGEEVVLHNINTTP